MDPIEQLRENAQAQIAAGTVTKEELRKYGRSIGLTSEQIEYALGNTAKAPSSSGVLDAAKKEADITAVLSRVDPEITAREMYIAATNPQVTNLVAQAQERVDQINQGLLNDLSVSDLAAYGGLLGLDDQTVNYALGISNQLPDTATQSAINNAVLREIAIAGTDLGQQGLLRDGVGNQAAGQFAAAQNIPISTPTSNIPRAANAVLPPAMVAAERNIAAEMEAAKVAAGRPMQVGRAVQPIDVLQYGYGPEQGLLSGVEGPSPEQIRAAQASFYQSSLSNAPTYGLLAERLSESRQPNAPRRNDFYAVPKNYPGMNELLRQSQEAINDGSASINDLRQRGYDVGLSPQITGQILSLVNQGAATPYKNAMLSGNLPNVAGENVLNPLYQNLPSNWSTFTPEAKINWFNANQVTPQTLSKFGVPQDTINWMLANGYNVGQSPK